MVLKSTGENYPISEMIVKEPLYLSKQNLTDFPNTFSLFGVLFQLGTGHLFARRFLLARKNKTSCDKRFPILSTATHFILLNAL